MNPQLFRTEKLQALEDAAEDKVRDAAAAVRRTPVRERGKALDRMLTALGNEIRGLLIIFLVLAILCAPAGLGLAADYFLAYWVTQITHSVAIGWAAGLLIFAFLCRYVWGSSLQGAMRRAAAALMAAKTKS